jgi:hypothetical protein
MQVILPLRKAVMSSTRAPLDDDQAFTSTAFATSLVAFDHEADSISRALRLAMAVKVFGIGTLLPNQLPSTVARSGSDKPASSAEAQ